MNNDYLKQKARYLTQGVFLKEGQWTRSRENVDRLESEILLSLEEAYAMGEFNATKKILEKFQEQKNETL